MGIEITSQPEDFVGAKNPQRFEFSVDDLISSAGTKANIHIRLDQITLADIAADTQISLQIGGSERIFVFKTTPDDSGYQLPRNAGSYSSMLDFINTALIPALSENYVISRDYNLSGSALSTSVADLIIEAKEVGSIYTITENSHTGSVVSVSSQTDGEDMVIEENFRVFCDLFFENTLGSGEFEKSIDLAGIPDANGDCSFEVSEYLRSKLSISIPGFDFTDKLVILSGNILRFLVRYCQASGQIITARKYLTSDPFYVFAGARKFVNQAKPYPEFESGAFLTNMASGSIVHQKQHQYLSFFSKMDGEFDQEATIKLRCKLYYTDATSGSWMDIESTTSTEIANRILTFRVGYDQLELDALKDSGKTVYKYEVKVTHSDNSTFSQTFTFYLNQEYFKNNHFFLFINSFGVPETIWMHGDQERSADFTTVVVRQNKISAQDDLYHGEFSEQNALLTNTYKINTGYQGRELMDYFRDFLLSDMRYEQLTDKYARIIIPAQSISLGTDKDTTFVIGFNYSDAWIERGNG